MKYLSLFCFSFLFSLTSSAQLLTDSLIFLYNFSGNTEDSWNNGLHSTNFGATLAEDRNGYANSAYYFDGVDDHLEIPNSPLIHIDPPVSFSFWMQTNSTPNENKRIICTEEEAFNYYGYHFNGPLNEGRIALTLGGGLGLTSPANRRTKISDSTITDNLWHHVVGVVRGPLDMDLYIDCEDAAGYYDGTGPIEVAHTDAPGMVGKRLPIFGFGELHFDGTLDQIAMWNRALGPGEVIKICDDDLEEITSTHEFGETAQTDEISVYPNPSRDIFTIRLDRSQKIELVRVTDVHGRVVFSTTPNINQEGQLEINIKKLPIGVYYLTVQSTSKIWASKLMKQ